MRSIFYSLALAALFIPTLALAEPEQSAARASSPVEVRPIKRSSTDLFEVLSEFIKAQNAYAAEDYAQSAARYRTVLLHDPKHIQARLGLGHAALELGYNALAADIFTQLSLETLGPREARSLSIGQSLSLATKLSGEDGVKQLKARLEKYPDAPRLWAALGDMHVKAKAYKQAAFAYNQARTQGYSEARYAYKYGLMNMTRGEYDIAGKQFKTAARLDPDKAAYDTHYRLAHLLGGNYISALEQMPAARAGYILSEAGHLAISRGEYELARRCLKKALEVSPRYNVQAAKGLERLKTHLQ